MQLSRHARAKRASRVDASNSALDSRPLQGTDIPEIRFDIPSKPPSAVISGAHLRQACSSLRVEPAIPALGPKAPLEGGDDRGLSPRGDAVADGGEIGEPTSALDNPNAMAATMGEFGRGLRPGPDARAGKPGPVKKLTGVRLAVWRNI